MSTRLPASTLDRASLTEVLPTPAPGAAAAAVGRTALLALPPEERAAALLASVRAQAAIALQRSAAAIDADRPLTALGLDSLAAAELAGSLAAGLGVEVSLADLLAGASLAEVVATALSQAAVPADPDSRPGPSLGAPAGEADSWEEAVPLSQGQRSLWFLERLAPGEAVNQIVAAAGVRAGLDADALAHALAALVERHPALRTTFAERDGEPVQRVRERLPFEELVVDARDWSEDTLDERLAAEGYRPFDLERGPLLRLGRFLRPGGQQVLLFAIHHLVADFWSLAVLARELGTLYLARVTGAPPVREPPAADYRDFAAAQRRLLSGPRGARLWAYWLGRLGGKLPALDLALDRPRPPVQTYRGAARTARLPPALSTRIAALAGAHGVTFHTVLLAGFQAMLHRLTGQQDLVVGSPMAGRTSARWAELVGYVVNPVALRLDLAGDPGAAELLARTRETVTGALDHQELPLALLVERLQPIRDPSRPPLFQAMFVLQRAQRAAGRPLGAFALGAEGGLLDLGGVALESRRCAARRTQFDLTLVMAELDERTGALGATLQYNPDLFDAPTVERWLAQLETVLAGLTAPAPLGAEQAPRLSQLPLLTAAERHQLLVEWNAGGDRFAEVPGGNRRPVHELFAAQAESTPDAVALVAPEGVLTYRELAARATGVARRLRRLGVGPEVRVAICAERSAALVAGLLGILEAGGAYVPLDPAYPRERLGFLLVDSAAAVLLAERRLAASLLLHSAPIVHLDDLDALGPLDAGSASDASDALDARTDGGEPLAARGAPPPVDPDNLAYLIYTSGSTGRPKGVGITHGNAWALLRWARDVFPSADLAGVLASTSICFDLSVFELFLPLVRGGSVRLAANALELPGLPGAEQLTLLNTVPSAMAELLRLRAVPPGVRTVNLAGEPLTRALVEEIHALGTVGRVLNLYGPSEDTTYSTWAQIPAGAPAAPAIGQPVAGSTAYVLDAGLEPLPIGAAGELYLGGAGLARGYLGRPELTAERFVPHPWSTRPGSRLYRTGDLVRRRASGDLEFLGRRDQQVKVRGFRIEPGEIEAVLAAHPAVTAAAVVVGRDSGRMTAYVVPAAPDTPAGAAAELPRFDAAALLDHLRARLPEFMVPADVVALPHLPRTANGKLDRRALAALSPAAPAAAAATAAADGRQAARTPTEELLAGIWSELLGVETVAPGDDFFALGGHSLLAARVIARVRDLLGVELAVRTLFEAPALAGLAARIDRARAADDLRGLQGLRSLVGPAELFTREPRQPPPRLSFAQERLWFLDRLEPGGAVYNMPAAVRLGGHLAPAPFAAALAALGRRHEILRTTFGEVAGQPVQLIADEAELPLPLVDLTALAAGPRRTEAARLAAAEARRPFDLGRGPLARAVLLRTRESEHLALFTLHHVVADGWSLGVFLRDLTALYAAALAGQPPSLPALPFQYADYAAWQRRRLGAGLAERQLAYWRRHLAGVPASLDLPFDRPRPAVQSHRGATREIHVPQSLARGLAAVGRRHGATRYMTLLAAFQALLLRFTGETDLLVGSPAANRGRSEIEDLVGFFVNTLPLRGDLAGDPVFADLLGRLRETALAAYDHQDLPFERLVEELRPERDLSRPPLVQVIFALQDAPPPAPVLAGLEISLLPTANGTAKFDLTLSLAEQDGELRGTLEYATDLFDAATVERLAGAYLRLLAAAAADPGRRLSRLPLLAAAERQQLLEWNDTRSVYPRHLCVHQLVERQARLRPEHPALVQGEATLTYGELDRRAECLARHLRSLGVGPEVPVGLYAERSLEMVVGMLGTLKAGGAYLPLDPAHPRRQLEFLLADTGVPLVLAQERLAARLPPGVAVVVLEPLGPEPPGKPEPLAEPEPPTAPAPRPAEPAPPTAPAPGLAEPEPPTGPASRPAEPEPAAAPSAGPESLAYVNYTSGSTGRPKGVGVPHRAVVRLVEGSGCARFGPDEVFLQLAPIAFDAATFEIWGALAHGATLAIMPPGTPLLADLAAALARHRVTTLWLTAGLFHQMVEERLDALAGLRQLLAGGEALSPPHVRRLAESLPSCRLVNGYGPTEGTTFTCCFPVGPARFVGAVPIGRPIGNTRAHLLDRAQEPVPIGVAGELYAGGDGLARGYLGRPGLTAERFVPDPWGTPGMRLYRTGDLCRHLADGTIEFLGRGDAQIKLRGFRIEPAEIEAALAEHPAVAAAAVLRRTDGPAGPCLVAYLAVAGPLAPPAAELRTFLAERLPEPMVPSAYVTLPALPLTANGKVDRRALAAIAPERGEAEGREPHTPTEQILAGIWCDLLAADRVSAGDDFFALGGHSLLAMRLLSRVRAAFGVELPVRTLFEQPGLAALATAIERLSAAGAAGPPPIPPRAGGRQGIPASFAQERLWFLDQLLPSPAYHVPVRLELRGPLDPAALAAAFAAIVRRHEALRTTFADAGAGPLQLVSPAAPFHLPVVDLSALAAAPRRAEAARRAAEEARRPFDLRRGPLLRATLLRLARPAAESPPPEAEHVALVNLHHIVCDGWSMGVLLAELSALYAAGRDAQPRFGVTPVSPRDEPVSPGDEPASPLPPLPIQYADFALWQRSWLSGETLARQLAYWRERLAGAPDALDLPADRPRPALQSFRGAQVHRLLTPALASRLPLAARHHGVTPFMLLLAALHALLGRLSGQHDLLVGSPIANRRRPETEGLIGLFVNTLVLRGELAGDPTAAELLARVRDTCLGAYAHQDLPFERLVEELRPVRDLSRPALFTVLLVEQNAPLGDSRLGDLTLSPQELPTGTAKFDLTVAAGRLGTALRLGAEFSTGLFDATTVVRLLAQLETVLGGLAAPDSLGSGQAPRLSQLPLLSAAERHQLLIEWNAAGDRFAGVLRPASAGPFHGQAGPFHVAAEAARGPAAAWDSWGAGGNWRPIHELFAAQAERTPDAVALTAPEGTLTYGALAARAAGLARRLRRLGVGPDVCVGVCAERSLGLVVGLLAILEAGGAYLPLDPDYPRERLAFMFADSAAAVLLTQEKLAARLPPHSACVVDLDRFDDDGEGTRPAPAAERMRPDPENLAYLIYTSGSTGRPKGVMNRHRGILNRLLWMQQAFRLDASDCVLQKTPFSFDVSVWEIFWPLLAGARLVLARPAGHQDPDYLAELIAAEAVTTVHFVPSMLQLFLESPAAARCPSLRRVIASGEALPHELQQRFFARLQAPLYNLYGPTEAAVDVTSWACDPASPRRLVPIGRPIANTRVHVLDRRCQPLPIGATGEIFLGGEGLARGYLGQPGLTAERFLPDGLGAEPGARLYRTGDLGRHLGDGSIDYLGRTDFQVKVRGFRIELGEIEAALAAHPAVTQAVVTASGNGTGAALAAYLVLRQEDTSLPPAAPPVSELRSFLGARLPDHMLPAHFMALARLPLSANGKVNRAALPAPGGARPDLEVPYVEPGSELERTVAAVWREVLQLERVGRDDNFFALGGTSLAIVQVRGRLRQATGRDLPLVELFRFPTIGAIAGRLAAEGEPRQPAFAAVDERARRGRQALARRRQDARGGSGR